MSEDRVSIINRLCERHPDVDREDIKSAYSIVTAATPASFLSFDGLERQILEWIEKFPKLEEAEEDNNRNTITPSREKRPEVKTKKDIYQWACQLTTEQHHDEYLHNPICDMLLTRLQQTKGNRIAVIGLQGSGKTALKEQLMITLSNNIHGAQLYAFKWAGNIKETIKQTIKTEDSVFLDSEDESYFHELFSVLFYRCKQREISATADCIAKELGWSLKRESSDPYWSLEHYIMYNFGHRQANEEEKRRTLEKLIGHTHTFERAVGREKVKEIRNDQIDMKLRYAHTILIDLPDYSRTNNSQRDHDLTNIDFWWENFMCKDEGHYEQNVNLVVFFQKELFKGHFSLGKYDPYELQPLTPQQFVNYFKKTFGENKENPTDPFTEKALREIAVLSRGIFRRFKKYVRICLEKAMYREFVETITMNEVREWISLDQLIKDMELELMTIFPRSKEYRMLTVKALQFLRDKGPQPQSTIAKEIFDGAKMKCSRVLDKLESWPGYITRKREGRKKIVSLA